MPLQLVQAYHWLGKTVRALGGLNILQDSEEAEMQVQRWKKAKVGVKPADLRIASIVYVAGAVLVTRNRWDFTLVPALRVEFWS